MRFHDADAQGQPRGVAELLEQADSLLQHFDAALRIRGDEPQAVALQRLSAGQDRGVGINQAWESQRLFQHGTSPSVGREAEEKEVVQSNGQPLRCLGVLPLHGPTCGRIDVGEISAQRIRPERLDRCTPRSTLDEVEEVAHVPITGLCWSFQPLHGVGADQFVNVEAGAAAGFGKPLDQRQLGKMCKGRQVGSGDRARSRRGEATDEDPQRCQHRLLRWGQPLPRAVEDGLNASVSFVDVRCVGCERRSCLGQMTQQLVWREHPDPVRGEFDGQRQTVEYSTDVGHGVRVQLGHPVGRRNSSRSVHEQGCRVVHKGIRLIADRPQRWDRIHDFSTRFQREPAGRQDGQARAGLDHLRDQRAARAPDLLAVVQHEQHRAGTHGSRKKGSAALRDRSGEPERGRRRRPHVVWVDDTSQRHPEDVERHCGTSPTGSDAFGHFKRQAGLSRTADPADGHHTRIIEAGCQGNTFAITADEAGQERRQRIAEQLLVCSQDRIRSE